MIFLKCQVSWPRLPASGLVGVHVELGVGEDRRTVRPLGGLILRGSCKRPAN